jgi:hypothetical protein
MLNFSLFTISTWTAKTPVPMYSEYGKSSLVLLGDAQGGQYSKNILPDNPEEVIMPVGQLRSWTRSSGRYYFH